MEHKVGVTLQFRILPFYFRRLSPWGTLIQLFIIFPLSEITANWDLYHGLWII